MFFWKNHTIVFQFIPMRHANHAVLQRRFLGLRLFPPPTNVCRVFFLFVFFSIHYNTNLPECLHGTFQNIRLVQFFHRSLSFRHDEKIFFEFEFFLTFFCGADRFEKLSIVSKSSIESTVSTSRHIVC